MKKIAFLISVGLLFASGLRTQEHAPTADVCRADQAAWHNTEEETNYLHEETRRINEGTKNRSPIAKMPFKEVNLRMQEMATCVAVDEENINKYSEMEQFYSSVMSDRYFSFIVRHNLLAKFKAEDDAGIR